jgi:hypothetical protein
MIAGELLSAAAAQPMDQQQRMRLADEKLLEERKTNSMRKMLGSSRAAAKIDYQSGLPLVRGLDSGRVAILPAATSAPNLPFPLKGVSKGEGRSAGYLQTNSGHHSLLRFQLMTPKPTRNPDPGLKNMLSISAPKMIPQEIAMAKPMPSLLSSGSTPDRTGACSAIATLARSQDEGWFSETGLEVSSKSSFPAEKLLDVPVLELNPGGAAVIALP